MLAVGYYTTDQIYADHAALLKLSLQRFKMEFDFIEIEPADWLAATAFKPSAILEIMERRKESALYLDVDSVVHENVSKYFEHLDVDVAVHFKDGVELISSTVYMAYNENVLALLRRWQEEMAKQPEVWDQKVLQNLLASDEFKHLKVERLSPAYTYIFDITKEAHPTVEPVIEQLQASREKRHLKLMEGLKYRVCSKLGYYPKSTRRMRQRRQRLAELSAEYNFSFTFSYQP